MSIRETFTLGATCAFVAAYGAAAGMLGAYYIFTDWWESR